MIRPILSLALATAVVAASSIPTATTAEAGRGGRIALGIAGGIIAGSILGGYAYARPRYVYGYSGYDSYDGPRCYRGPRQCDWSGRRCGYDRFGDYLCTRGEWRCWRPTVCD
jgi:hypothetical protein